MEQIVDVPKSSLDEANGSWNRSSMCQKVRLTKLMVSDGACTECACEMRCVHLAMDILCQEMRAAWWSQDCEKWEIMC